jgi:hypothetical protein
LKSWTPKSVAAWVTTGLGIVSVAVGIILGVRQLLPSPKPPRMSAVFILDVSPAMQKRIGETTKLAAAEGNIIQSASSLPGVSTSLRLVKGCEGSYTAPTVPFGTNNAGRYDRVFSDLGSSEQSASGYVGALASAANDLATKSLIADSKEKLLIVFMAGSRDTCPSTSVGLPIGQGLLVTFFWLGHSTKAVDATRRQLVSLGFTVQVHAAPSKKKLRKVVAHAMVVARARSVAIYRRTNTRSSSLTTTGSDTTGTETTATDTTATNTTTADTTATETTATDTTATTTAAVTTP